MSNCICCTAECGPLFGRAANTQTPLSAGGLRDSGGACGLFLQLHLAQPKTYAHLPGWAQQSSLRPVVCYSSRRAVLLVCPWVGVPPRPGVLFPGMDVNDEANIRAFWDDLQRTNESRSSSWDTFAASFEVGRCVGGRGRGDSKGEVASASNTYPVLLFALGGSLSEFVLRLGVLQELPTTRGWHVRQGVDSCTVARDLVHLAAAAAAAVV